MISKRSFFRGVLAVAGAVAAAPFLPEIVKAPVRRWSEIVNATLRHRSGAMLDNLTRANPLLRRLQQQSEFGPDSYAPSVLFPDDWGHLNMISTNGAGEVAGSNPVPDVGDHSGGRMA